MWSLWLAIWLQCVRSCCHCCSVHLVGSLAVHPWPSCTNLPAKGATQRQPALHVLFGKGHDGETCSLSCTTWLLFLANPIGLDSVKSLHQCCMISVYARIWPHDMKQEVSRWIAKLQFPVGFALVQSHCNGRPVLSTSVLVHVCDTTSNMLMPYLYAINAVIHGNTPRNWMSVNKSHSKWCCHASRYQ